ncbi:hypothetical protein COL26b_011189 [Colletotrichum chrysophilum]|uniref:uncharacterized protein n=1 Tax=Colletotrichum chrysophilum TaxID=1836956 RepID=UPI002301E938|nr:uncharacterized protein COL26b_011189 [Colletotrichum chrysophilum]KAJ0367663.1 hypothetical protein COL26b_011189 [Colletotrichum chrysophilum]
MSDTPIDPIPFADKAIKLDIVVVGHGIAGLVFAIDAKLRGHQVQILEKRPGLDDFVDKYLESPNRGAVVLSNGVRIEADLIVAADGVGSKSWDLVRNIKDQAIGDAAHAFLPTSGYGASMAMEDAHSLVECLSHVEQQDIALALRVHNCLRFERTACAQKMGFKARELWHKTDWNSPIEDPTMFTRMWAPWLLQHDPEDYARKNFATCAQELRNGEQFQNSNSVPGYKFKMWTVRDLAESTNDGLEDEGEWFATE